MVIKLFFHAILTIESWIYFHHSKNLSCIEPNIAISIIYKIVFFRRRNNSCYLLQVVTGTCTICNLNYLNYLTTCNCKLPVLLVIVTGNHYKLGDLCRKLRLVVILIQHFLRNLAIENSCASHFNFVQRFFTLISRSRG